MITDIFIRSYEKDIGWLQYCLRSIPKFCSGFRDVIVVVPEQELPIFKKMNLTQERLIGVRDPNGDGYMAQQLTKINADHYTDADLVLFTDSDATFLRHISPQDFFVDDKPYMLITPYSELGNAVPWKPITEKALGFECPFETMRRLPFVYKPKLLKEFRAYMEGLHGMPVEKYVMSQPNRAFSEFNAIGSWTHKVAPDEFFWWNTAESNGIPEPVVRQEWSWGGLNPKIRANLEQILS